MLYLISDGSQEDNWNKVINVFMLALALNRLCMHNKYMRVHYPRMLV